MSPSAPTSSPLISGTVIGSPQPTNPTTPSTAINNQQSSTTNHYTSSISQYTNQLSNCLSMKMRFWCFYEWYYSTIDRDYFRRNEFKSYLRTKGLQDVYIIITFYILFVLYFLDNSFNKKRMVTITFIYGNTSKNE